jgi:hypothetical protein
VVLQGFIDDSGSDGTQPPDRTGAPRGNIFVLAGFLATAEQWESFSDRWEALCDLDPKTPDFKMVKAYRKSGKNSYGWKSAEERDAKINKLVEVIISSVSYRLDMAVAWPNYNNIVKGKVPENIDSPYFLLFYNTILATAAFMDHAKLEGTVDFVFDDQGKFGNAALGEDPATIRDKATGWYRQIRASVPQSVRDRLGSTPVFRHDKDVLALKAADVYAWQIRRHYDVEQPRQERPNDNLDSILGLYGVEGIIEGPHLGEFVENYNRGILALKSSLKHFIPEVKEVKK